MVSFPCLITVCAVLYLLQKKHHVEVILSPKIFVSKNFRVKKFPVKKFSDASICLKIKNTDNFWTGSFCVFNFRVFGGVWKYFYTENFQIYGSLLRAQYSE